jgi:hypothetical protein
MDIIEIIKNAVEVEKQKEYANKPIRTLGEVLLLLESQPQENVVKLDFCEYNPVGLTSYRGYYEDLSIDYKSDAPIMTVGKLTQLFEQAIGKTFRGYKGGDFAMNTKTLIWVAPYGNCGRMLTDIKQDGESTVICTMTDE